MSVILGLHIGHDASVAVLQDGKVAFCLSEERLSRQKMHYGFPFLSLEKALNVLNLDPGNIDLLAFDTNELARIIGPKEMERRFGRGVGRELSGKLIKARKVLAYLFGNRAADEHGKREVEAREILLKGLERYGFVRDRVSVYDHHLCHAATAFWPSPFDEAVIVTSDGRGDDLSATIGYSRNGQLSRKIGVGDLDSIGQFYAAVTFYLGFRPNRHEGKITGLAAHGDPARLGPVFLKLIEWLPDGSYRISIPPQYKLDLKQDFDDFLERLPLTFKDRIILHSEKDLSTALYTSNWYSFLAYLHGVAKDVPREDVAAGVQYFAEEVCAGFVQKQLPETQVPVVLAGGVFSNVRINQRIRELPGVTNVFVQPAMGDEGLSLGAALVAYSRRDEEARIALSGNERPCRLNDVYLGPEYTEREILAAYAVEGLKAQAYENIEERIAGWLHKGLVVGFFHGRLEFGPRALGHRSILVRPTDQNINHQLNKRLHRTEFMPFAPSILAEYADQYLESYAADHVASEFMTITYRIRETKKKEIEAAVHVDGTARPQVVHREKEPVYHKIIEEYYKRSGVPVIINTSFNIHEEPIVCTPEDALRSFKADSVDILVIGRFAIGAD